MTGCRNVGKGSIADQGIRPQSGRWPAAGERTLLTSARRNGKSNLTATVRPLALAAWSSSSMV